MGYLEQIQQLRSEYKGQIWNPQTFFIYLDDPKVNPLRNPGEEFDYKHEIMNVEEWGRLNSLLPEQGSGMGKTRRLNQQGQAAAAALEQDPLRIIEAFKGPFADLANDWLSGLQDAVERRDKGQATAFITSKDYSLL